METCAPASDVVFKAFTLHLPPHLQFDLFLLFLTPPPSFLSSPEYTLAREVSILMAFTQWSSSPYSLASLGCCDQWGQWLTLGSQGCPDRTTMQSFSGPIQWLLLLLMRSLPYCCILPTPPPPQMDSLIIPGLVTFPLCLSVSLEGQTIKIAPIIRP